MFCAEFLNPPAMAIAWRAVTGPRISKRPGVPYFTTNSEIGFFEFFEYYRNFRIFQPLRGSIQNFGPCLIDGETLEFHVADQGKTHEPVRLNSGDLIELRGIAIVNLQNVGRLKKIPGVARGERRHLAKRQRYATWQTEISEPGEYGFA